MLDYNSITYTSHNERNREEIKIERDATVWEMLCRVYRHRTFKVSMETLTIYERVNGWQWLEKDSGEPVDIQMFHDLNGYVEYTTSEKCTFW